MEIKTVIYVEPMGKARPRTVSKGGKTWTYTPKPTVEAEAAIRQALMRFNKFFAAKVPLKLRVVFYRQRPKTAPKKVKYPVTRPDLDQYLKLLLDACQGYIFSDDAAIINVGAHKRFGSPPRIELCISDDLEKKTFIFVPTEESKDE